MPATLINELTTSVYGLPSPCLMGAQCYVPLTVRCLQSSWRVKLYLEAGKRVPVPDGLYGQSSMRLLWADVLWEVSCGRVSCSKGSPRSGQSLGPWGRTGFQAAELGVQGEPRDHIITHKWPAGLYDQGMDPKGLGWRFWTSFGIRDTLCLWKIQTAQ